MKGKGKNVSYNGNYVLDNKKCITFRQEVESRLASYCCFSETQVTYLYKTRNQFSPLNWADIFNYVRWSHKPIANWKTHLNVSRLDYMRLLRHPSTSRGHCVIFMNVLRQILMSIFIFFLIWTENKFQRFPIGKNARGLCWTGMFRAIYHSQNGKGETIPFWTKGPQPQILDFGSKYFWKPLTSVMI